MVPLASLWLPILVSAVLVFLASWIVHMFLPYHRSDYDKLPQEDAVLDTLRSLKVPTGQYLAPFANTPAQMQQPDYVEKRKRGPALFMTLTTSGETGMGKSLLQWFIYVLIISLLTACLAQLALAAGAPYPDVFKFAGLAAFMAYAVGHPHQSVWYRQKWSVTVKYLLDGLIYSLLTAGVFGWLWPRS